MRLTLVTLLLTVCSAAFGQELPQSSKPGPTPERQKEIRDSIRQRSRVKFLDDEGREGIGYEADRALLMPKMERTSIFRIGVPGWLMRFVVNVSRDEFDSDEEYRATKRLMKRVRGIRVAAFVQNPAYDSEKLLREYQRFVKRKKSEPVMLVRAPEGGVQIDVKQRRNGTVRLISLVAYGDEGAAVIRLKTKIREKDLKRALKFMTDAAEESAGVEIDTET